LAAASAPDEAASVVAAAVEFVAARDDLEGADDDGEIPNHEYRALCNRFFASIDALVLAVVAYAAAEADGQ
jgi:hypothetical protein